MPTIRINWADNTEELRRNLAKGLDQIEATKAAAEKMVRSLSGEGLLRSAANYAAAIQQIGGAANLTISNQSRVNDIMKRAVEQLEAAGRGSSDLANHYRDLARQTEQVEKPTSAVAGWFGELSTNVVSMAAGFISAQAVIGAVTGGLRALTGVVVDSVKSAQSAEAAQSKLNAALRQQGTFTPEIVGQYGELSTAMQQTTVFSDDLTTEMQALLVQVGGVMPSAMKGALKASADLASGLGIDLQQATTLVAKAAAGHTETLGRYGITVSDAELKSKGFAAVLEAINRQFGGQAAAQAQTYAGSVQQLANAWDNLKEAIGRKIILDPIILATITRLTQDTEAAGSAADEAAEATYGWKTAFVMGLSPAIRDAIFLFERAEEKASEFNAMAAALSRGNDFMSRFRDAAADQTAQHILAAGMAESARLAEEETKKREALTAAIKAHTKAIQEQADALSGRKAAADLRALQEAWEHLTPAERDNEQAVTRLLAAYEPLRAQLAPDALPADFEALRAGTAAVENVMRSRAIPTFQAVGMTLEQMRNLSQGFTASGLIPMNAQFTDAARQAAVLAAELQRLKTTRDTLAAAIAHQNIPLPGGQSGINSAAILAGQSSGDLISEGFKQGLDDLPAVITQAFANSGSIRNAVKAAASRIGAALGEGIGKALGGEAGGKIGAALGSMMGVVAEKLYDAFTTSAGEDVMHRVGRRWGAQITEAMGDQIAKDAKELFHGSRQAAELFNFHDIITHDPNNLGITPRNFDVAAQAMHDVFSMIETGQMTIAQGAKVIDENWQDLLAAGTDSFGFINGQLRELIRLDKQFGTQSKEIAAFLKQQGEAAVKASNEVIAGLAGMARTQAELEDLGTLALATFSAAIASGKTFAEAIALAGPGLQQLSEAFDRLGVSTDNAALKALMLQSQIAKNNPALIQGVAGLGQAFAALSNMGLLNVETFQAMQRTGLQMYSRLQGEVAKTGGTTRDALLPMQDYLHRAQKAAEELGIPLDENTQMLIDQSKELGIWKEAGKSATEKLTDGMEALVDAVRDLIAQLSGIPRDIRTTVTVDTVYTDPVPGDPQPPKNPPPGSGGNDYEYGSRGGLVTPIGLRYLGAGGPVWPMPVPIGRDIVPTMLALDEVVMTPRDQAMVGLLLSRATGSGGGGTTSQQAALASHMTPTHLHVHVGDEELVDILLDGVNANGKHYGKFAKSVVRVVKDRGLA